MRALFALAVFLVGFGLYVAAVLLIADHVRAVHWTAEFVFFALAGIAWVWPAKKLMFWAARAG